MSVFYNGSSADVRTFGLNARAMKVILDQALRNLSIGFILLCAVSCGKDNAEPREEKEAVLLEKVYLNDQLYIHIFYDNQQRIERLHYYNDRGEIKSRRSVHLDDSGRVQKIILDFGHYVATHTLTYEGNKKVMQETTYQYADGRPATYGKRVWKYPSPNVVQDILYINDLTTGDYTTTFTFAHSGNIEKKVREVAQQPALSSYELYEYDEGISYEYLIESNIPGYYELPISKNQPRSQKVFNQADELIAEVSYRNTYNADGYLVRFTQEYAGGQETYRMEYKTITYETFK